MAMSPMWALEQTIATIRHSLKGDGRQFEDEDPEDLEESLRFSRIVSPDVSHLIILNVTSRVSGFSLTPMLSVRHNATSILSSRFMGLMSGGGEGSYGKSLTDLAYPELINAPNDRWLIRSGNDITKVAAIICGDISKYGDAFFSSCKSSADIVSALECEKRHQVESQNLAILYALTGQTVKALVELAICVREAGKQVPPLSTQSWMFIRSFISHFEIEDSDLPFEVAE